MSERSCVTVLWTIENFYHSRHNRDEDLTSRSFFVETLSQSEWNLRVYPNDDEIKVYLDSNSFHTSSLLVIDYEISFLSKDGSVLWTGDEENVQIKPDTSYEIQAYPTYDQVFGNQIEEYLPGDTLTIRCRIWKSRESLSDSILFKAVTRIEVERRMFHFQANQFSQLTINGRKVIHTFKIGEDQPTFVIELSLTGASANTENVNIDLKQESQSFSKCFSTCKISVLNSNGSIMKEGIRNNHFFDSSGSIWNFPRFLTKNELTSNACNCLVGDVLNLLFNFTFATGDEYAHIECVTSLPSWIQIPIADDSVTAKLPQNTALNDVPRSVPDSSQEKTVAILQDDFLTLYKDQSLSDFKLKCESSTFPVHKIVLAARSSVFKAMFTSDMKEGVDSFMDIPDVDAVTLDQLLVFIYTGRVQNLDSSSAVKLFYAADKYDVLSLKQKCSAFLSGNISVSNVCQILCLAERHDDDELKSSVHDFIVHNDDKIIRSTEWKKFLLSNPVLAVETFQTIYSKKLEMLAK